MRIFIIFLLFVSCHSAKNKTVDANFKQVVIEQLGDDVKYDYNERKELVLCKKSTNDVGGIDFLIYDLKNSKIVYHEKLSRGRVIWKTNFLVEVFVKFGNRTPENPEGYKTYIIDAITGEKIDKESLNK